jgi:hypothetical protein
MKRKYLFFHTGKAALFLFYALVIFLLSLFYVKLTHDIPRANMIGGGILYLGIVVFYALRMDRTLYEKSR